MQVLLASCAASRGAASCTESERSGVLGLSLFNTPSALADSESQRDRETGKCAVEPNFFKLFHRETETGKCTGDTAEPNFSEFFRKVFFSFRVQRRLVPEESAGTEFHDVATSQLVGFILGYHSGRLRVLLLVASPLQTRVLVQSVVPSLRQHFGLRHHWLLWGGSRPLSGQGRAYRELPQCHHGGRSERFKHVRLQNG